MRMIRTFALVAAMTLPAGGCAHLDLGHLGATISNIAGVVTGANVSPQAVVVAVNAADGLQDTATAYLQLPRCRAGGTPICRQSAATQPLKRAVLTMRAARNDLEDWYAAHPNTAPPASLYEKVTGAARVLGDVINRYQAGPAIAAVAR